MSHAVGHPGSPAKLAGVPAGTAPRPWLAAGGLFTAAFVALVVANGETLNALARLWAFDGLEYGFVIVGISLWLLWRSRDRLRRTAPVRDWRGLWLVIPVSLATWLAYLLDVRIAQESLFVAALAALTWTLLGPAVLRIAAGPLSMLVLALPIWNDFAPALQSMTVRVVATALDLSGTPAFVEETQIDIPGGAVLVLAQCSGTQYFQAGVTLGALYAYVGFQSLGERLAVLGGFALMAAIGNWIRVYVLIHLGALSDLQHFFVGWGIFALLLGIVFWVSVRLGRREIPRKPAVPGGAESGAARVSLAGLMVAAVVPVALLSLGPLAVAWPRVPAPARAGGIAAPAGQPPWSGPSRTDASWWPSFAGAATRTLVQYRSDGAEVSAYWASYPQQGHRSQAVNQTNTVYSSPWEPRGGYTGTHYKRVMAPDQHSFEVIETWLSNPRSGAQRLVWQWYCVAGRGVTRPWDAKLLQLRGLLDGRADAQVAALSTDARDPRAARDVLQEFVLANFQGLAMATCMERR